MWYALSVGLGGGGGIRRPVDRIVEDACRDNVMGGCRKLRRCGRFNRLCAGLQCAQNAPLRCSRSRRTRGSANLLPLRNILLFVQHTLFIGYAPCAPPRPFFTLDKCNALAVCYARMQGRMRYTLLDGGDDQALPRKNGCRKSIAFSLHPLSGSLFLPTPVLQVLDLNEIEEHVLGSNHSGEGGGLGDIGEEAEEDYPKPPPALGSMKLSSDQRMLACTIDMDGSDRFVLAVFDLMGAEGEHSGGGGGGKRQQGPTVSVLRDDAM